MLLQKDVIYAKYLAADNLIELGHDTPCDTVEITPSNASGSSVWLSTMDAYQKKGQGTVLSW